MSHFSRAELIRSQVAQERAIDNQPPLVVLAAIDRTLASLERVRAILGHPMQILSGYRSPKLNAAVGGSRTSQHMSGQAVDFVCPGFGPPVKIFEALVPLRRSLGLDQIILERTWIHVSFTDSPRYMVLKQDEDGVVRQIKLA